ncbi:serine threonine- kinase Nek10-like [Brachionus plicatilis]|uniref:Serine threonine-kinase Nek10-like n=1 Tax=Brachionus plicatilis TaxID=10195 RepID=A0A3M7RAN4_BRAPC|nr:serine threonine- kinase Nek10-like [Brachionus plicatilis]
MSSGEVTLTIKIIFSYCYSIYIVLVYLDKKLRCPLPPSGKKNFKRKLVDRFKRYLFSNKKSSPHIKTELMKLIKNSLELIDMEMIGLKSFQINTFNSSESNRNVDLFNQECSIDADYETIINQNGLTYEQLQTIIEDLLHNRMAIAKLQKTKLKPFLLAS